MRENPVIWRSKQNDICWLKLAEKYRRSAGISILRCTIEKKKTHESHMKTPKDFDTNNILVILILKPSKRYIITQGWIWT